jgi:AraC-like DNA-binding protein
MWRKVSKNKYICQENEEKVSKNTDFLTFFTPFDGFSTVISYFCSMITLGEMQISGMLTMVMLALILLLRVPRRAYNHQGFATARWLMVCGTLLIALQFLLQHEMGLRQMGITQAVLVNLLFFMPASLFIGMAVLYVQRQGRVSRREWAVGLSCFAVAAVLLLSALLSDGVPLTEESPLLRCAEYASAGLYLLMQGYVFMLQLREYRRLQHAVDEYFDRERHDLLLWMGLSTSLMALMALMVPIVIFMQGIPLVVFSVVFFLNIAYCVISLYSYGISEDASRVVEAEATEEDSDLEAAEPADPTEAPDNAFAPLPPVGSEKSPAAQDPEAPALTQSQLQRVEHALELWTNDGGFRQHNLTLSIVARQIDVPVRHLQLWLRQSKYQKLAVMMNTLRIDEAKRMLQEHPDWDTESVADHCGFSSRQYFHQLFQLYTDTTPAKYQKQHTAKNEPDRGATAQQ